MSDIVERLLLAGHGAEADEAAHEIMRLRSYVEKLESRLEIDCVWRCGSDGKMVRVEVPKNERPDEPHDGIFCRDETIKLQHEAITRLRSLLKEAGEALKLLDCALPFDVHEGLGMAKIHIGTDQIHKARIVLSKIKGEA